MKKELAEVAVYEISGKDAEEKSNKDDTFTSNVNVHVRNPPKKEVFVPMPQPQYVNYYQEEPAPVAAHQIQEEDRKHGGSWFFTFFLLLLLFLIIFWFALMISGKRPGDLLRSLRHRMGMGRSPAFIDIHSKYRGLGVQDSSMPLISETVVPTLTSVFDERDRPQRSRRHHHRRTKSRHHRRPHDHDENCIQLPIVEIHSTCGETVKLELNNEGAEDCIATVEIDDEDGRCVKKQTCHFKTSQSQTHHSCNRHHDDPQHHHHHNLLLRPSRSSGEDAFKSFNTIDFTHQDREAHRHHGHGHHEDNRHHHGHGYVEFHHPHPHHHQPETNHQHHHHNHHPEPETHHHHRHHHPETDDADGELNSSESEDSHKSSGAPKLDMEEVETIIKRYLGPNVNAKHMKEMVEEYLESDENAKVVQDVLSKFHDKTEGVKELVKRYFGSKGYGHDGKRESSEEDS